MRTQAVLLLALAGAVSILCWEAWWACAPRTTEPVAAPPKRSEPQPGPIELRSR